MWSSIVLQISYYTYIFLCAENTFTAKTDYYYYSCYYFHSQSCPCSLVFSSFSSYYFHSLLFLFLLSLLFLFLVFFPSSCFPLFIIILSGVGSGRKTRISSRSQAARSWRCWTGPLASLPLELKICQERNPLQSKGREGDKQDFLMYFCCPLASILQM